MAAIEEKTGPCLLFLSKIGVRRLILLGLLLWVTFCFWNILYVFFTQDDFLLLADVQKPMPNMSMLQGSSFFRPLAQYWVTLLCYEIWGLNPFWHHLVYLLFSLATIALLFNWLFAMSKSTLGALAGSILYGLSKIHLYTLAWISDGNDVTGAFFLILALWAVNRYFQSVDETTGKGSAKLLWLIGISFCLGLLSKESCITFAPVCLIWIIVRNILSRRRFQSAQWKLAIMVVVISCVYLIMWRLLCRAVGTPGGKFQFDLNRGLLALRNSVIAVIPVLESRLPVSSWWLLAPLAIVIMLVAEARKRLPTAAAIWENLALGMAIWIVPAAIYVFTEYPFGLQLYHSIFCIVGLSLLLAMAVSIAEPLIIKIIPRRSVANAAVACVFIAWIGFAGASVRSGARRNESAGLFQASTSKVVFEQIQEQLQQHDYREIVFLDVTERVQWAMYFGKIVTVYHPEIKVRYIDQNPSGGQWHTSSTTLVMRQMSETKFSVVK
jgi:hypothetical protein